jgi:hypothetical protein
VLIKQLPLVPVERFHDEQVGCYARVPGVAGQFAQDHLLKVLALAEVIVTCLMIPSRRRSGREPRVYAPAADVPAFTA